MTLPAQAQHLVAPPAKAAVLPVVTVRSGAEGEVLAHDTGYAATPACLENRPPAPGSASPAAGNEPARTDGSPRTGAPRR